MVGETVSHYHIVGKLGGGGMGLVYDAEDMRLGRHVALKFIPENLVNDRKALERFEREARAASQLNHPGICTIYDIEDMNGQPFIVMEKLEGMSLKDRLRGKPMDIEEMLGHRHPGKPMRWPPATPKGSFIATSSRRTSLLPRLGRSRSWTSDWSSCRAICGAASP